MAETSVLQKAVIEILNVKPEEIKVTGANTNSVAQIDNKQLNNRAAEALGGGSGGRYADAWDEGEKSVKFIVQFNPAELRISAEGAEQSDYISDLSGSERTMVKKQLASRTRVNFKLIIDEVKNEDVFQSEYMILHPEELKNKTGNYLKTPDKILEAKQRAGEEAKYTVRTQVEGFLAALRNEFTRNIRFTWGKLSYSGILNTVQAEYTMFNPKGIPVRAEISIGILCMDAETKQAEN